jgi:hypothetical protein
VGENRGPRPVNGPRPNTDSPNTNTGDSPKSE